MKIVGIVIAVVVVLGVLGVFGRGASSGDRMPDNATDEDVRRLAENGQKIQAVKWYRALHGVGLKEAKDAVEAMARRP